MAAKKSISFEALMNMKENEFIEFVQREGKMAELDEIAARSTEQKVYPKIQKPMRKTAKNVKDGTYDASKMTWQADKSKKPTIKVKPITFFEVKTAFANEVLKLQKKEAVKKPTFRDRIAKAAQNS